MSVTRFGSYLDAGVLRPAYIEGAASWSPAGDVPVGDRDPQLWPFLSTSVWNLGVGVDAGMEAKTAPRTKQLHDNVLLGTVNGGSGGYSVGIARPTNSDPLINLHRPNAGAAWTGVSGVIRIPPSFVPPVGSDHNSVVIMPDGRMWDLYKLIKISDTEWTSTSVEAGDGRGTGLRPGVRAANMPLVGGLIRDWMIKAVLAGEMDEFGIALAVSMPEHMLGPALPDPGWRWPANARDQTAIVYTGLWSMGAYGAGYPADNLPSKVTGLIEVALANTLVRRGFYIIDRGSTVALYVEPGASGPGATSSQVEQRIRAAWRTLIPFCGGVTTNTQATPNGVALGEPRRGPDAPPLQPAS